MSINFESALGLDAQALNFRSKRAEVIANNIANADTPGYKARDMDFSAVLAAQSAKAQGGQNGGFSISTSNDRHIQADVMGSDSSEVGLMYRNASNPSLDQNSVDAQVEQAEYAKNAVDFQASFTILNQKFKGLMSAIRGE